MYGAIVNMLVLLFHQQEFLIIGNNSWLRKILYHGLSVVSRSSITEAE